MSRVAWSYVIIGIYRVDILHTEVAGHSFLNGPAT